MSCQELMGLALARKLASRGRSFSLCSIINARSGKCSEDCRYCTQSAHFSTDTPVYPLLSSEEIVSAAAQAKVDGASRFSLVTSGRGPAPDDLPRLCGIIARIKEKVGIKVCGSFGIINEDNLSLLAQAGLSRYHHNLETSAEFFPQVTTTHGFTDRQKTIRAAQAAGLEVCAGGIIGLGESEADRVSLACSLADLGITSVPLNILIPLPGTPLADFQPLPVVDILRTIALFRLILPTAALRLAAGRESGLADFLSTAFMAGADGMMIGGYLTQRGRSPEADRHFVEEIRTLWIG